MAESNLSFAKIVSNPTQSSWSQAYSAGKLFAVISLNTDVAEGESKEEALSEIGKEILSTLEQEFFTLEVKDLDSIKQAISITIQKIPPEFRPSLVIIYIAGSVLYIFIYGKGKVTLKRGSKIGDVLEGDTEGSIKSASGFLQNEDVIILQTDQFSGIIPRATLVSSFDHQPPSEIAEMLAPHIHEREEGGASALILEFSENGVIPQAAEEQAEGAEETPLEIGGSEDLAQPKEDLEPSTAPEESLEQKSPTQPAIENLENIGDASSFFKETEPLTAPRTSIFKNLNNIFSKLKLPRTLFDRSKRIYLVIALIILLVLGAGIIFTRISGSNKTNQELFAKVYAEAKNKYDEGVNLSDLNRSLAIKSFESSKKIINENLSKFPKNSTQEKELSALLVRVNEEISGSPGTSVSPKEIKASESPFLEAEINNSKATYFAQNDSNIYFLDSTGVIKIAKSDSSKQTIIKKGDIWATPGGLSVFLTNLYVLDKDEGQIIKFVPASGSAYTNSNYLTDASSFSKVNSIAIDGAIYVLFVDGKIDKFLKGTKQSFNVTGLNKPLSNPTRIYTDADSDSIYILDKGGSRVVVLNKEGNFTTDYSASLLKNALDFEVLEKDKKINFLADKKVYQIEIK